LRSGPRNSTRRIGWGEGGGWRNPEAIEILGGGALEGKEMERGGAFPQVVAAVLTTLGLFAAASLSSPL